MSAMVRLCLVLLSAALSLHAWASELAPLDRALTLAQVDRDGRPHTLLVLAADATRVRGVDLSAALDEYPRDALALVRRHGHAAIAARGAGAQRDPASWASWSRDQLLSPAGDGSAHVAAGINYPEHGAETEQPERPFLFPKRVAAGPSQTRIATTPDELLDHEVELCVRFEPGLADPRAIEAALVGLFVCGDFTDRAELLRRMDLSNVPSGLGFTDAKSKSGYFPTGPWLVVPRDWRGFVAGLQLRLTVNGEPRQDGMASEMILPIEQLAALALADGAQLRWRHADQAVPLLAHGSFDSSAVLLTGTPDGVIFRPPSAVFKVLHGTGWFVTGGFLRGSVQRYVADRYVERLLRANDYLKPGDRVQMQITWLGSIQAEIVSAPDTVAGHHRQDAVSEVAGGPQPASSPITR